MQTPHTVPHPASPFHSGEQAVQSRLGVREAIEPWALQVVRSFLPEQHREFYSQLPFVVAAARDDSGQPWATLLVGPPGFVQSPDAGSLEFAAQPLPGDALATSFVAGADIGLLGIELHTRRRNRVNGQLTEVGANNLRFGVTQAFGNCPQYITERSWQQVDVSATRSSATHHQRLDTRMREWITSADTLFIASGYREGDDNNVVYGMDASHRGGAAGFVKVASATQLVFPDYAGNNHYNTIGNLVLDPRVGLLFVDFETGGLLQISGKATIDWDSEALAAHPGAQRLVIVDIEQIVRLDGVLPLRWSAPGAAARELRLVGKTRESSDVTSFEFVARDKSELPDFEAGQHLPIELRIEGQDQPLKRTYTLSGAPGKNSYRISVKREPLGIASRHLHDKLVVGDIISATKPAGEFVLKPGKRPVALVSAGIGVTPMISMLRDLALQNSQRSIYFVHGARNGEHHPLADEVRQLARQHGNISLDVVYSQPLAEDTKELDYNREGRINADLLADLIPALDADFYLCGPTGFLADITATLGERGVNPEQIHTETF